MNPFPLNGEYPAVPGNKPISMADLDGPAIYAVIVQASPPTGGQLIQASAFGLSRIECVLGTVGSTDGKYSVVAFLNPLSDGQPATSLRLMWIVTATGAEVAAAVDLSGVSVRVAVIGLP